MLSLQLQFLRANSAIVLVGQHDQPAYLPIEQRDQRLKPGVRIAANTSGGGDRLRETGYFTLKILYQSLGHRQHCPLIGQWQCCGAFGGATLRQLGTDLRLATLQIVKCRSPALDLIVNFFKTLSVVGTIGGSSRFVGEGLQFAVTVARRELGKLYFGAVVFFADSLDRR